MKATGIVRRVDELGRIVIPKEIRRTLHIKNGDPLEIYTTESGGVILKKYSALKDLSDFAAQYADSLAKTSGHTLMITDRDVVVAVSGASKREYLDKKISRALENIMEDRDTVINKGHSDRTVNILEDKDSEIFSSQVITPILAHGDAIGTVMMLSADKKATFGELETKLTQSAATIIGRQLEQ
jgi:AbrB family transcriptional regulator (stage V sporulation protein T)